MADKISIEEIRGWLKDIVTIEFLGRVKMLRDDNDHGVHIALEGNEKENAALFNAGMRQNEEVLNIPELMIAYIKEEKEEREKEEKN